MVTSGVTEDEVLQIKRSPWADNFFRPLLITIMIMCFNYSMVALVRVINPAWRGTYFLMGLLVTTVEAIYSYRVLRHWRSRGISVLRYRVAEWTVLLLMLKILSFADKPVAFIWTQLQAMWQDPANFIDFEYYVLLVLAFIAWAAATDTMADFEALHDPYSDRTVVLDNLATRFFWGGTLLVLISGISRWILTAGISSLVDFQRPTLGGIIFNVLLYFVLGLVLLSQARLTTLLVRWRVEKITVPAGIVKRWAKYGSLLLGFIALLAFFLPTGYTLGILTSAAIVIRFLLIIIGLIVELLLFLISLPVLLLFNLLGHSPIEPTPPPTFPALPERPLDVAPTPWLEAIRSLVFWLLALAIIWYLVKVYLSDHPELIQGLKRFRPIALIISLTEHLWQWLMGLVLAGFDRIPKRVILTRQEPGSAATPARLWRWFGLGGLSPRERIVYYYLNILKRVEQRGPARQGHQTPFEYEPGLKQAVPAAQTEVHQLTGVFVRARYSREEFTEEQATLVKWLWQQIRRELRKKPEPADENPDASDS